VCCTGCLSRGLASAIAALLLQLAPLSMVASNSRQPSDEISSSGLEPLSVYNSPGQHPCHPCSSVNVWHDEKENALPSGTPQGQAWHASPAFSGRPDASAANSGAQLDAKKGPGAKETPGAKQATRVPLRNITPLFARKVRVLLRSCSHALKGSCAGLLDAIVGHGCHDAAFQTFSHYTWVRAV